MDFFMLQMNGPLGQIVLPPVMKILLTIQYKWGREEPRFKAGPVTLIDHALAPWPIVPQTLGIQSGEWYLLIKISDISKSNLWVFSGVCYYASEPTEKLSFYDAWMKCSLMTEGSRLLSIAHVREIPNGTVPIDQSGVWTGKATT